MRILAFDTATRATSVALDEFELRDDPPAGERPRHTTRLMPLIVEVLERTQTEWSAIDRIAVGVGPGTFTGLRIGVATARSLSRARRIPLVGVSTLESLALNASGSDLAARGSDAPDAEAVLEGFGASGALDGMVVMPVGTVPGPVAVHLRITETLKKIPALIAEGRRGGLTLAPEVARDDMREQIRKPINNQDLYDGAAEASRRGWRKVKLYFMCGLPGERPADIDGIVEMAETIARIGKEVTGRYAEVTASVSNFVPKPHTPYQ